MRAEQVDITALEPRSARIAARPRIDLGTSTLSARGPARATLTLTDKSTMTTPRWDEAGDSGLRVPVNSFYQRLVGYSNTKRNFESTEDRDLLEKLDSARNSRCGTPRPRSGRLGAPWRHIRQCTGNLGNHICFVDGVVKENDTQRFPPYGYVDPTAALYYATQQRAAQSATNRQRYDTEESHQRRYTTATCNDHAKQNFRFWNEDRKPATNVDRQTIWEAGPRHTARHRMMNVGVCY